MVKSKIPILLALVFLLHGLVLADNGQKIIVCISGNVVYALYAPRQNAKQILKYTAKSGHKMTYYSVENTANCHIINLLLNESATMVAYSELCKNQSSKGSSSYYQYQLSVLNIKDKSVIMRSPNAYLFSFSPDGRKIAYSEGIPGERGSAAPPGYQGGLWIYDFGAFSKDRVNAIDVYIMDMKWSKHDGNLYYTNNDKVFKYDPKSAKSTVTAYKGIYFSDNGNYYLSLPEEGRSYIYKSADNTEMTEWEKQIAGSEEIDCCMLFKFWSKKLNAVVFGVSNTENVVFDVGKGKVIGKFNGWVLGTNADGSLVAVNPVKTDNKKAYEQSQVEIINLLEVVSKYQAGH